MITKMGQFNHFYDREDRGATPLISEEDFSVIFDHSSEGMAFIGIDGRFVKLNQRLCQILGYTKDELIRLKVIDIIHSDDLAGCFLKREQMLNNELFAYIEKVDLLNKQGERVSVIIHSLLLRNEDGSPRYFLIQFHDVTSLQLMEEDLSVTTKELESIYESVLDGIIVLDNKGNITKVNNGFKRIFGWTDEEIIGQNISNAPDDTKKVDEYLLKAVLEGKTFKNYETIKQCKGGKCLNVSISASPLRNDDGDIIASVAVIRDITESLKMKEVMNRAEKLNLVGQMTASITHEIRNPLAVIRGFIQLLRKDRVLEEETRQKYFDLVLNELDRTNSLISDFLSLSQTRMVPKENLNLNDILNGLYPILSSEGNLKGVSFDIDLDHKVPSLFMNEREIKQLILNIVQNGIDAMAPGGHMHISTKFMEELQYVRLQITDSGSGIPEKYIDKLFDPFYTSKTNGTGLGLAVCKSICDGHNATIKVDSTFNVGTTITIDFPV
nr:PAS domain-containing sensor histidine kinase [Pullulanibacillus pueri]